MIEETVIVIAIVIVIAKDDDREATIVIAKGIVSERNGIVIAIAGIEKIVEIVKMRTRKRSGLRRNLWMVGTIMRQLSKILFFSQNR